MVLSLHSRVQSTVSRVKYSKHHRTTFDAKMANIIWRINMDAQFSNTSRNSAKRKSTINRREPITKPIFIIRKKKMQEPKFKQTNICRYTYITGTKYPTNTPSPSIETMLKQIMQQINNFKH